MRRLWLLLLCGVLGAAGQAARDAAVPPPRTDAPYRGEALDTEHGLRRAYSEEHRERFTGGRQVGSLTVYKTPDGRALAERDLDFTGSDFMPDYRFKDLRNGYEEGARVEAGDVRVFFRDSLRAPLREKRIKVPEPRVVNGGLNPFLKRHWRALEAGQRLSLYMVVPARLDYYRFVAYVDTAWKLSERESGGRRCRAVVIEPQNTLLRMLLPPIVIIYDLANLRMVRYQGISNIADAKGRSLRVRVDYPGLGP